MFISYVKTLTSKQWTLIGGVFFTISGIYQYNREVDFSPYEYTQPTDPAYYQSEEYKRALAVKYALPKLSAEQAEVGRELKEIDREMAMVKYRERMRREREDEEGERR
mmetsp:Transcript_4730/g.6755  ORF Transcript_4730/g.6755 Transcript_4730/m.6755 type:complete len:108 (+) Transcript_4730:155-478(+)